MRSCTVGDDHDAALVRAMGKAGRVVCFSGIAIAAGLTGLLFFERSYLFTLGVGGLVVVALSVIFALTFLPALLSVLGPRINAGRVRIGNFGPAAGFWQRMAVRVMDHPLRFLVPTALALVVMGVPFFHLRMSASDVRILDDRTEARRGYDTLVRDFPHEAETRLVVAAPVPHLARPHRGAHRRPL